MTTAFDARPPRLGRVAGWPVRRRIAVALGLVAVVLLTMVGSSAVLLAGVRDSQDLVVVRYFNALTRANGIFVGMVNAETAVRGYALSRDPGTLQPYLVADSPWSAQSFASLRDLLPPGTSPEALAAFEAASSQWNRDWAEPAITAVRAGQSLPNAEITRGKQLFDQVRATYEALRAQVLSERQQDAAVLESRTTLLFAAVVVTAVTAVAIGVLLWLLLARWVSRPVARLGERVRLVSTDDLQLSVVAEGPPEFVALAADVDSMRRRLLDQVAAVERAGREVADARRALERQAAELERSNRDLEQFAYVASHDLQEPLRKVTSFCQMLQRRYAGRLDDRADQYIDFAVDGATRMQQLISDLLEFSRVGRSGRASAEVDLQRCFDQALANLAVAQEQSAAVVTCDPLPQAWGEAPLITQLLQNVIGNAIKFRSGPAPRVHVGARRDGDMWQMWCTDDGIGIEPQYAERIFLIFQRLHPKDVYTGTGIGLAMCQKIVEYHGGRIWIDTSVPSGTTIRWTLPVAAGTVEDAHEGAVATAPGRGSP